MYTALGGFIVIVRRRFSFILTLGLSTGLVLDVSVVR